DPLANPGKTFATLRGVAQTMPDVQLCLSTNGLALADHVDEIAALNVQHVTITINAIDPVIGARIYPWIFYGHKRIHGPQAAEILCRRQMEGLRMLTARGILCKVNSVMIPGINDDHLIEVNRAVKENGAFLHNIMPLISAPEHGTAFGLSGQRAPTARELKVLQDRCEGGTGIMRHCRQCRADAVGLLGEDRAAEFTLDKIGAMPVHADGAARRAAHAAIEQERLRNATATKGRQGMAGGADEDLQVLVAVATRGAKRINQHFGQAREFQIYEVRAAGSRFIGHRRIDLRGAVLAGEEERLRATIRALRDCHAVLAAQVGGYPRAALAQANIEAIDGYAQRPIGASLLAWFEEYARRVRCGEIEHKERCDAPLRQGAYVVA
nr:nitrogenase cofactor biosynthesis protein NifB [Gammaproteobacteria bacterium]